jgi:hypothetical protein
MYRRHYPDVDLHRRRTYVVLVDRTSKIKDQRCLPDDAMAGYVAQLPGSVPFQNSREKK